MVKVRTASTVLVMVSLLGIASCSDDDGDEGGTTTAAEEAGATTKESTEPILIKTHLAPLNARGESFGTSTPPGVEQRSDWKVVKGLVGFEGLSGGGRMRGVLEPNPPGGARETFTGTVAR